MDFFVSMIHTYICTCPTDLYVHNAPQIDDRKPKKERGKGTFRFPFPSPLERHVVHDNTIRHAANMSRVGDIAHFP